MQVTASNFPSNDKLNQRSKQFMRTADVEELRKRNEDYAVELRKQKRKENYHKRRFIVTCTEELPSEELINIYPELRELNLTFVKIYSGPQNRSALFLNHLYRRDCCS